MKIKTEQMNEAMAAGYPVTVQINGETYSYSNMGPGPMGLMEAMDAGKEIVIMGPDCNSSIFWKDRNGSTWTFTRELGIFKHPASDAALMEHFSECLNDGLEIVVKGA